MHSQVEKPEPKQTPLHSPGESGETTRESLPGTVSARADAEALRERYLDQVCKPFGKTMSEAECEVLRQELRAHLDAAAAAYEELGTEPMQAMQETLERFGNAVFIGKGLQQAHRPSRLARLSAVLNGLVGASAGVYTAVLFSAWMNSETGAGMIASALCGFLLGFVTGLTVWKKRLTPLRSSLLAGAFFQTLSAGALLALCLLNQSRFDASLWMFLGVASLLFGTAGAGTGAVAGWSARLLRRWERQRKQTEK